METLIYCGPISLLAADKQIDSSSPPVLGGRKSTGVKRLGTGDSWDPKQASGSAHLQFSDDSRKLLFSSFMVIKEINYSLQCFVK